MAECKHRYEPFDIGYRGNRLQGYHWWRCARCYNTIFSKLEERADANA